MEVYFNELSLQGTSYSWDDFEDSVKEFYEVLSLLQRDESCSPLYVCIDFFHVEAVIDDRSFFAAVSKLEDKGFVAEVIKSLSFPGWTQDWRANAVHNQEDDFEARGQNVTGKSIAELSERQTVDNSCPRFLLNRRFSTFEHISSLAVTRNNLSLQPIVSYTLKSEIVGEIRSLASKSILPFDANIYVTPQDGQTVLGDRSLFRRTGKIETYGSRMVYEEILTGHFWYVDNFHKGADSHLEVFNQFKLHLGEAEITGRIKADTQDRRKRLKLN